MKVQTVVIQALQQELGRVRSKLEGAEKRLDYHRQQVTVETDLIAEFQRDADQLADAIRAYGGDPDRQTHEEAAQATRTEIAREAAAVPAS